VVGVLAEGDLKSAVAGDGFEADTAILFAYLGDSGECG
jgi:hypothetical protein